MPVPTTITDLSVTVASNSPAGADTVTTTTGPDEYFRALSAILRRMQAQATVVASASTVDLGAVATGDYFHISGTTTITAFGTVAAGIRRALVFDGALILTHNATSLILPGGANITTVAGDVFEFVSEGSGNWRCTDTTAFSRTATTATTATNQSGGTVSATTITASGLITSTMGNNSRIFAADGATTGYSYMSINNTSGGLLFGVSSSAGGALITGDTAYDAIIRGTSGLSFSANDGVTLHMRLTSAGVLNLPIGQLKFPATQNASADVNTMDDYEEGSFTLTAVGMTTSPTVAVKYTKIGNLVTLTPEGSFIVSGTSNSTGKSFTGLPAALYPAAIIGCDSRGADNGGTSKVPCTGQITSAGAINIYYTLDGSVWTDSGTCQFGVPSLSYPVT